MKQKILINIEEITKKSELFINDINELSKSKFDIFLTVNSEEEDHLKSVLPTNINILKRSDDLFPYLLISACYVIDFANLNSTIRRRKTSKWIKIIEEDLDVYYSFEKSKNMSYANYYLNFDELYFFNEKGKDFIEKDLLYTGVVKKFESNLLFYTENLQVLENIEYKEIILLTDFFYTESFENNYINSFISFLRNKYSDKINIIVIETKKEKLISSKILSFLDNDADIVLNRFRDANNVIKILKNTKGLVLALNIEVYKSLGDLLEYNKTILFLQDDFSSLYKTDSTKKAIQMLKIKFSPYPEILGVKSQRDKEFLEEEIGNKDKIEVFDVFSYQLEEKNKKDKYIFLTSNKNIERDLDYLYRISNLIIYNKKDIKIDIYSTYNQKNIEEHIIEKELSEVIELKGSYKEGISKLKSYKGFINFNFDPSSYFNIKMCIENNIPFLTYDNNKDVNDLSEKSNLVKFDKFINNEKFVKELEKSHIVPKIKLEYNFDYDNIFKLFNNVEIDSSSIDKEKESIKKNKSIPNIKDKLGNFYISSRYLNKRFLKIKYIDLLIRKAFELGTHFPLYDRFIEDYIVPKKEGNFNFLKFQDVKKVVKEEKLVSIVIPSYNSATTVLKTIKSCLNQTYKNVEIIVVDDGSKDNTKEVLSKVKDPRVKYFYKENEGLGLTRNYGIKKSSGDYIFFLDGDDIIPKHSIASLYYTISYYDLEILTGKTLRIFKEDFRKNSMAAINIKNGSFSIVEGDLIQTLLTDTLSTNKIYKKEVFYDYDIWFEKGLYEDKLFTTKIYSNVKHVGLYSMHIYNWIVYGDNTSITTDRSINNMVERLKTVRKSIEVSNLRIINEEIMQVIIYRDIKLYINNYKNYSQEEKIELFNIAKEIITENIEYLNVKNIADAFNKKYVTCILNNDFECFDYACEKYSKKI